jgi:hypothetical protein
MQIQYRVCSELTSLGLSRKMRPCWIRGVINVCLGIMARQVEIILVVVGAMMIGATVGEIGRGMRWWKLRATRRIAMAPVAWCKLRAMMRFTIHPLTISWAHQTLSAPFAGLW